MTDVDVTLERQIFDVPQGDSGNLTYIITARQMISGEELNRLNGLAGLALDLRDMRDRYLARVADARVASLV